MHTVEFIQDCLDRYAAGDENAVHQLMVRVEQRLRVLAYKALEGVPSVKGLMTADDVTNDFYVKALEAFKKESDKKVPETAEHFLAWSATLLRNRLNDAMRKFIGREDESASTKNRRAGNRQSVDFAVSNGLDPVSNTYDPAEIDRYTDAHRAIARLPEHQRRALDLRYFHGYGNIEAAELAGVSPRTMTLHYQQALATLGVDRTSLKSTRKTEAAK